MTSRPGLADRMGCVIVAHGPSDTLPKLTTMLCHHGLPTIVVDNGREPQPTTLAAPVISAHGNLGYGAGANLGFRWLAGRYPMLSWVLIANADTVPTEQALLWIESSTSSENADILSLPYQDTSKAQARSHGLLPSVRATLYTALFGEDAAIQRWPERAYPKGAFFAIRRILFEEVGGFDTDFFLYFEETDLFRRTNIAGGTIQNAPSTAWVEHVGGESTRRYQWSAGLLLGIGAGRYARKHAPFAGLPLACAFALQFFILAGRHCIQSRPRIALRWLAALVGLLLGIVAARWSPESITPLMPVRRARRAEYGLPARPR